MTSHIFFPHQDDDDEEGGGEKFPDMEKNPFSELADNESLYVEVTLQQLIQDHYRGCRQGLTNFPPGS